MSQFRSLYRAAVGGEELRDEGAVVLRRILKKRLFRKMLSSVDMVKMGIFTRLAQRLQAQYTEQTADLLAAAVVHELFSEIPSGQLAQDFLKSNYEIVERELSKIKHDSEICRAVTQAVRVRVLMSCEQRRNVEKSLAALEKLEKLGILVPGVETPTPSTFLSMAHEFWQGQDT